MSSTIVRILAFPNALMTNTLALYSDFLAGILRDEAAMR
jgi:hypothetical protein